MAEIERARGSTGLSVVSTFSGCGGSCLGFEMAGYDVRYACEFVEAARDTYRLNHPATTFLDPRDIRAVRPEEILERLGLKKGELDVFEGSPPCASFSTAGNRDKDWGKVKAYCVDPETRVLGSDLRHHRAGDLAVGDQLVGFEEENTAGHRGRRFLTTTVERTARLRRPSVRVELEDGTSTTCSTDHRWLVVSGSNLRWKRAGSLCVGDVLLSVGTWDVDETRDAGYLAGLFDGEGCVSRSGSTRLVSMAQKEGPVLERAIRLLGARGFEVGEATSRPVVNITINGGLPERLRFLGQVRPERLVAKAETLYAGVNVGAARKVRVRAIEALGEREVVAITTRHATLVADGLLSHNSDVKQRTDDLFFEWARILEGLQPRVFVAENVSGLVKGKAFGYFKMILARLEECGYIVGARVLDAQWLGVPQQRQRLILIGVRKDIAKKLGLTSKTIPYPKPRPYFYSMRDALPHLSSVVHDTSGLFGQGEVIDKPSPAITFGVNSVNSYHYKVEGPRVAEGTDAPWSEDAVHPIHSESFAEPATPFAGDPRLYVRDGRRAGEVVSFDGPAPTIMAGGLGGMQHSQMVLEAPLPRIDPTPEELEPAYKAMNAPSLHREWDRTAVGEQSDKYFNMVKANPALPSPAILAMHGKVNAGVCHPYERRKFTIREVKRVCAFPDDFKLAGTYAQQWERLGRSVPPRMMYTVAAAIRDGIFARLGRLRDGWSEAP
jgi:DNA (cytosine-5)-methyltransferase 1